MKPPALARTIPSLLLVTAITGCIDDPQGAVGVAAQDTCQRVFVSGMAPEVAQEQADTLIGLLLTAYTDRPEVEVDYANATVRATLTPNFYPEATAEAAYVDGYGCTVLQTKTAQQLRASTPPAPTLPALPSGLPWPQGTAGISTPAPAGVDLAVRETFYGGQNELNTHAVAIAQQGQLIYERYLSDEDPSSNISKFSPLVGFSMTKSVTALALGRLYAEGQLSLFDTVPMKTNPAGHQNTYLQLLRMESDLDWLETGSQSRRSDVISMVYASPDVASYAASTDVKGSRSHNYSTGNSVLLTWALQQLALDRPQALTSDPLTEGLRVYYDMFAAAGIRDAVMQFDESGTLLGGSHLMMPARDWLRMGQLMLDDGVVNGQQVVPRDWIDFMRLPSTDPTYGGHMYINEVTTKDDQDPTKDETVTMYRFAGLAGQNVFIIPDRDVVITRLGASWDLSKNQKFFEAVSRILEELL